MVIDDNYIYNVLRFYKRQLKQHASFTRKRVLARSKRTRGNLSNARMKRLKKRISAQILAKITSQRPKLYGR